MQTKFCTPPQAACTWRVLSGRSSQKLRLSMGAPAEMRHNYNSHGDDNIWLYLSTDGNAHIDWHMHDRHAGTEATVRFYSRMELSASSATGY